jgi:hypothetical protein
MNNFRTREHRHGLLKLAALAMPLLIVIGCSSASSGHAPGVAGGQTLTPGVTNFPLAYIKKPVPKTDINVRDLITSITGGDVYVRDQTNSAGAETNITASITQGKGDVRDLDVSPDGTKLVFSLRLPLNPNKANTDITQPNWKIYQYDASTKVTTQLTNDNTTAGHDVGAHYLPDGRIVFSSTRQAATQAILLDEGRPQYAAQTDDRSQSIFLLHVMNADGSGIHQISFNTNHDFAPSLLNNGQIVFSRWDPEGGADQMSLYRSNPDGTAMELLYGANSHASGANIAGTNNNVIQFLNARQLADGSGIIAIVRPLLGTQFGGDIVKLNTDGFVEIHQPATPTGSAGTAQVSATTLGVTTDANMPSMGGRFASAFPLYDGTNRMLVSWSPCLVLDTTVTPNTTNICTAANTAGPNVTLAPPQYTLWIYDLSAGTLGPVLSATPGLMVLDPVIMQARTPAPTFIRDAIPTDGPAKTLFDKGVGVLDISSVYDVDGTDTATPNITALSDPSQTAYNARPYRFIRVQKAVEIPGQKIRKIDPSAFGPAGMGMREILGYAPIQPDGSVQIQVPANVPFIIDVVDQSAKRVTSLGRHTSWLQLLPGETRSCNGCHSTVNKTSHGRIGLTAAVNQGPPIAGQPFPNTNPTLTTQPGETMAQTLARITCVNGSNCSQLLTTDVLYTGIWTTGTTPAAPDNPITYAYADLISASPVTPLLNPSCLPWTAQCRVTLHYANDPVKQVFLQSIWNVPGRLAKDGVTPATCVTCHTTATAAANVLMVPQGQLDLTGMAASATQPAVLNSYEELLFPHNEQTLNMAGVPTDLLVPTPGPPDPVTGLPTTVLMPVVLQPPMVAGSAAGSTAFLRMFDGSFADPVLDHTGFLSPAELRLIVEWLDIGAQYYNDPFVAPVAN